MLAKAYDAQCAAVKVHCTSEVEQRSRGRALFALALGSFCVGTSEFASMGFFNFSRRVLESIFPLRRTR